MLGGLKRVAKTRLEGILSREAPVKPHQEHAGSKRDPIIHPYNSTHLYDGSPGWQRQVEVHL
jgi:hypothetical protein